MSPIRRALALALVALPLVFACSDDDTSLTEGRPPLTASEQVTEADVKAAEGATLALADGATLEIPPGALPKDEHLIVTTRTVNDRRFLTYVIEPTGIALLKPAKLTFRYETYDPEEPLISVFESSVLNPIEIAGSEKTDWVEGNVVARDAAAHTLSVELAHFTVVFAAIAVDKYAYLVVDIPPKYLEPGDLIFVLTHLAKKPGPNWQPGHVGMFAGNANNASKDPGRVIEADGDKVVETTLQKVKSSEGHAYLGPRRWRALDKVAMSPGADSLSAGEQTGVVTFLEAHIGDDYALIGDQSLRFNGNAGDTFSCVGLCEAAFSSVGKHALAPAQRVLISTPLEMFWNTAPVEEITMDCGEAADIPVSAVILDPRSPYLFTDYRGFYSTKQYYSVTLENNDGNARLDRLGNGTYNLHYQAPSQPNPYGHVDVHLYAEISATDPTDHPISIRKLRTYQTLNVNTVCSSPLPDAGADTGTRVPLSPVSVTPISAVFTPQTFSTSYNVTIQNPNGLDVTTAWTGPNCSTFSPSTPSTNNLTSQTPNMIWQHPHPPCDATTDHKDVTIKLDVTWPGGAVQCTYQGADDGVGPACTPK